MCRYLKELNIVPWIKCPLFSPPLALMTRAAIMTVYWSLRYSVIKSEEMKDSFTLLLNYSNYITFVRKIRERYLKSNYGCCCAQWNLILLKFILHHKQGKLEGGRNHFFYVCIELLFLQLHVQCKERQLTTTWELSQNWHISVSKGKGLSRWGLSFSPRKNSGWENVPILIAEVRQGHPGCKILHHRLTP